MIEVQGLTKRYGAKTAVDGLTFGIEPGKVTGFLGPNGAGKTTTMRCILGLDYPDAGIVTVDGSDYRDLRYPMREVGALLDAKAVHGGRSAYNHLLCLAQTNNLPKRRVGEVLELVGLTDVARKRAKGFSLGMSQRLGIAVTLLAVSSMNASSSEARTVVSSCSRMACPNAMSPIASAVIPRTISTPSPSAAASPPLAASARAS